MQTHHVSTASSTSQKGHLPPTAVQRPVESVVAVGVPAAQVEAKRAALVSCGSLRGTVQTILHLAITRAQSKSWWLRTCGQRADPEEPRIALIMP